VIHIKQDVLDKARAVAPAETATASDILNQAGIEKSAAQKFAEALAAPILSLRLQSVDTADNAVERNAFSVLAGKDSCWLLTGDTSDGMVSLKAIRASELERIITVAYVPFQDKMITKNE